MDFIEQNITIIMAWQAMEIKNIAQPEKGCKINISVRKGSIPDDAGFFVEKMKKKQTRC